MEADWSMVKPGDLLKQPVPGNSRQNGVVGSSGILHRHSSFLQGYLPLSLDEIPIEFRGIASFKPPEVLSQSAVKGVGSHGHDDLEIEFDQDGRRECIEVEEFHRFQELTSSSSALSPSWVIKGANRKTPASLLR